MIEIHNQPDQTNEHIADGISDDLSLLSENDEESAETLFNDDIGQLDLIA